MPEATKSWTVLISFWLLCGIASFSTAYARGSNVLVEMAPSIVYYQCDDGIWFSVHRNGSMLHSADAPQITLERQVHALKPRIFITKSDWAQVQPSVAIAQTTLFVNHQPVPCRLIADPSHAISLYDGLSANGNAISAVSPTNESFRQPSVPYVTQEGSNLYEDFDKNGNSQLCGPSALAQQLLAMRASFPDLKVSKTLGNDVLKDAQTDPNVLVERLARTCKTDFNGGTNDTSLADCVAQILNQPGYSTANVVLTRTFDPTRVRHYLKNGYGAVMLVSFMQQGPKDPPSGSVAFGHFVSIVGYDYDSRWHNRRISLQIVNPERITANQDGSARQEHIWLVQGSAVPSAYGPNYTRGFAIYGEGFANQDETTTPVVTSVLFFHP